MRVRRILHNPVTRSPHGLDFRLQRVRVAADPDVNFVADYIALRQAIEPSPALAVDEQAPALGASQAPARRMRRQMRKLHTPYTF